MSESIPAQHQPPLVLRYATSDELVDDAARRLLDLVLARQQEQDAVHLCLSGGHVTNQMYAVFADLAAESELDAGRLHVWWSDDLFLPTIDPARHATQTLSMLARRLQLNTAQIHPVPASDGNEDPDESAFAYAQELGDTIFDFCILGVGEDGHVASIFPGHRSSEPTPLAAIGVQDAPKLPSERISLSLERLSRSRDVWFLTVGQEKAAAVWQALEDHSTLPAARVHGMESTTWFLDDAAATWVPRYSCEL